MITFIQITSQQSQNSRDSKGVTIRELETAGLYHLNFKICELH